MADRRKHKFLRALKRWTRTPRRWLWRITAAALILAAVLLTVARLLLPFASEYRAELEQRVERYLGAEVAIAGLDIGWRGFVPRLQLTDVRVEGIGPVPGSIAFDQAFVTVMPAWSDGRPTLRIADVSLLGLDLALRIDESGRVHALGAEFDPAGLAAAGTAADGGDSATTGAFGVRRLQLLEASVEVTGPGGNTTLWRDIELRLANAGRRHRLSLSLTPPPAWGASLRALLEFEGDAARLRDGRARLYLEGEGLVLDAWADLWPAAPMAVDDGRLGIRLWGNWDAGAMVDAQAELEVEDLALAANGAAARFERVAGRARLWRPAASQWQLDVGGLEVRRGGRAWADGAGLSLAREDGGDWRLAAEFLRVEDVAAVAALLPPEGELLQRLGEVAPAGDLHGLHLAVEADGEFGLRTDFRDLGWSASGAIPGMSGLDGRARVGSGGGRVALESSDVEFAAPRLFRAPLQMRELSAVLRVAPGPEGLVLTAPRVHVRNDDLSARGRVRVELAEGRSPLLDLQFDYRDGVAAATPTYLPAGIMPAPVVDWLDQAFVDGRVRQGSFVLRGRAADFPYREHAGVFDVRFDVADVTLDYGRGWPVIEGMNGRVHFAGPGLTIRADDGRVREVRVQQGRARFPDLRAGQLEVALTAAGPVDAMLHVVRDSPLVNRFGPVVNGARGGGEARLELGLAIPVKDLAATRVDGDLYFTGAALSQPRFDLAFDDLRGRVRFSERSVSIDGLAARLRGRPLRIDAATPGEVAIFRGTGAFAPAELLPALAEGPLAAASGRADWDVILRVPLTGGGPVRLEAQSELVGTRIDLPPPIGKDAEASRRLELELPFVGSGPYRAQVRYGSEVRAQAELGGGTGLDVRRLGLAFGTAARLPGAPGLRLGGRLPRLDAAAWLQRFTDAAVPAGGLSLREVDLGVDALHYRDLRMSDLRLTGRHRADEAWQLELVSNEAVGEVVWPPAAARGDPVRARFEWIDLALLRGHGAAAAPAADGEALQPSTLPSLDLRVERLKLTDATLQQVVLVTGAERAATIIHRLDFHTEQLRVDVRGAWQDGQPTRTRLRVIVRSDNFGQGLAQVGRPGVLAGGEGKLEFQLAWPGAPWAPGLAVLSGHAELELHDGVLLQVNPGAARLLGMFSLEAVPFRTLLQKGLIFNEMRGRVDLEDGNAYTGNLNIDSAIGEIRVRGRTGLVARDHDYRVLVQPELSSTLPVLGFLSGGPIAGAAVALIQGVLRNLGGDVEKLGQVEYRVTGSWDQPQVERVDGRQAQSADGTPKQPEVRP